MNASLQKVDHSALRVNQITIIALNVLAFILNAPWLVILVMGVMALGTLLGIPGFGFLYRYALKPLGWVKAYVLPDNPEPHRFSQGFGVVVMGLGSLALLAGASTLGWALVWLVAGLAALNAFAGFCAGCAIYYWLNRLSIPGFHKAPPPGVFPGARPRQVMSDEH